MKGFEVRLYTRALDELSAKTTEFVNNLDAEKQKRVADPNQPKAIRKND